MKSWLIAIKFVFIGALFIISNNNLHLGDSYERGVFIESFLSWISELYDKTFEITGYVVNSEWLPGESVNGNSVAG